MAISVALGGWITAVGARNRTARSGSVEVAHVTKCGRSANGAVPAPTQSGAVTSNGIANVVLVYVADGGSGSVVAPVVSATARLLNSNTDDPAASRTRERSRDMILPSQSMSGFPP